MKNFIFELMSHRRKMAKKAVAISIWVVVQFWQTTRQFELLYEYLFQMLIYTVVVLDVLASFSIWISSSWRFCREECVV